MDLDPGGPKTNGSGSATLLSSVSCNFFLLITGLCSNIYVRLFIESVEIIPDPDTIADTDFKISNTSTELLQNGSKITVSLNKITKKWKQLVNLLHPQLHSPMVSPDHLSMGLHVS
jgi:hypothetical protein